MGRWSAEKGSGNRKNWLKGYFSSVVPGQMLKRPTKNVITIIYHIQITTYTQHNKYAHRVVEYTSTSK